jgi:DNA-binding NarL/FixJ family response regulator
VFNRLHNHSGRLEFSHAGENGVNVTSVLIVDDSLLIRRLLRAALTESEWITCEEAENGREGIVKAQEVRPDVIILDLAMPEMNGLQTARVLKRILPTTPLLMFTTHVVPDLEKEALSAGVHGVVSKSDGAPAVIRAIRNLVAA